MRLLILSLILTFYYRIEGLITYKTAPPYSLQSLAKIFGFEKVDWEQRALYNNNDVRCFLHTIIVQKGFRQYKIELTEFYWADSKPSVSYIPFSKTVAITRTVFKNK